VISTADALKKMPKSPKSLGVAESLAVNLDNAAGLVAQEAEHVLTQQRALHENVNAAFEQLVRQAKLRCGQLKSEIDTVCASKHKQLVAQKESLDCARDSILGAVAQIQFHRRKNDGVRVLQTLKRLQLLLSNVRDRELGLEPVERANVVFAGEVDLASFGCVRQSSTDVGKSIISGLSRETIVGETVSFDIHAMDVAGACSTLGGDVFLVSVRADAESAAAVVREKANGLYHVTFTPTVAGKHIVAVTCTGKHVHGSPFSVLVHHRGTRLEDAGAGSCHDPETARQTLTSRRKGKADDDADTAKRA